MADSTLNVIPINPAIQAWLEMHASSVNNIAASLGVPSESIAAPLVQEAGTIILEMATPKELGSGAERHFAKYIIDDILDDIIYYLKKNENIADDFADRKMAIEAGLGVSSFGKLAHSTGNDIGWGNINLGIAILTLENYCADPKYQQDPLDLAKYKGNYLSLAQDLIDPNSATSFAISGLIAAKGNSFFSNTYGPAYKAASDQVKSALLTTWFKQGAAKIMNKPRRPGGGLPDPSAGDGGPDIMDAGNWSIIESVLKPRNGEKTSNIVALAPLMAPVIGAARDLSPGPVTPFDDLVNQALGLPFMAGGASPPAIAQGIDVVLPLIGPRQEPAIRRGAAMPQQRPGQTIPRRAQPPRGVFHDGLPNYGDLLSLTGFIGPSGLDLRRGGNSSFGAADPIMPAMLDVIPPKSILPTSGKTIAPALLSAADARPDGGMPSGPLGSPAPALLGGAIPPKPIWPADDRAVAPALLPAADMRPNRGMTSGSSGSPAAVLFKDAIKLPFRSQAADAARIKGRTNSSLASPIAAMPSPIMSPEAFLPQRRPSSISTLPAGPGSATPLQRNSASARSGSATTPAAGERASGQRIAVLSQKFHTPPAPHSIGLRDRALGSAMKSALERNPGGPNTGPSSFDTSQFYAPAGTPTGGT